MKRGFGAEETNNTYCWGVEQLKTFFDLMRMKLEKLGEEMHG